jgi:hypothetical protein
MILDRFGRDQHELLVRQLLQIKQSGPIAEYIDKFAGLIDQLAAYEGMGNPLHFTMRFIDGLKDDLKSAVLIQRPKDLDTAYILAQLQEELSESSRKMELKRQDYPSKSFYRGSSQFSSQSKQPKQLLATAEDRRSVEAARLSSTDEKWRSLRAFR